MLNQFCYPQPSGGTEGGVRRRRRPRVSPPCRTSSTARSSARDLERSPRHRAQTIGVDSTSCSVAPACRGSPRARALYHAPRGPSGLGRDGRHRTGQIDSPKALHRLSTWPPARRISCCNTPLPGVASRAVCARPMPPTWTSARACAGWCGVQRVVKPLQLLGIWAVGHRMAALSRPSRVDDLPSADGVAAKRRAHPGLLEVTAWMTGLPSRATRYSQRIWDLVPVHPVMVRSTPTVPFSRYRQRREARNHAITDWARDEPSMRKAGFPPAVHRAANLGGPRKVDPAIEPTQPLNQTCVIYTDSGLVGGGIGPPAPCATGWESGWTARTSGPNRIYRTNVPRDQTPTLTSGVSAGCAPDPRRSGEFPDKACAHRPPPLITTPGPATNRPIRSGSGIASRWP